MKIFLIVLLSVIFIILAWFLFSAWWCVPFIFSSNKRQKQNFDIPKNSDRTTLARADHKKAVEKFNEIPYETAEILSRDGLRLRGRFFSCPGSVDTVIIFHGYRSNLASDSCAIARICLERGFNVLAVHQRAHGESEGKVVTFGIRERYDCVEWINYVKDRLGDDCRILLSGVSMGASTIMMASDIVPNCVKGIFADCGFTSPKDILCTVVGRLGFPIGIFYLILRTGAFLFAGFNTEESDCPRSLAKSDIPLTIVHSKTDGYVPFHMAERCFAAAKALRKRFVVVPEANHALSYFFEKELYEEALSEMLDIVKEN